MLNLFHFGTCEPVADVDTAQEGRPQVGAYRMPGRSFFIRLHVALQAAQFDVRVAKEVLAFGAGRGVESRQLGAQRLHHGK